MRQPTLYVPHGGGPWPWLTDSVLGGPALDPLRNWLRALPGQLPAPPRAILVVSAHWEAAQPTVLSSPRPPMLYDYGGFPPHTYEVQYPAPGAVKVAARVRALLAAEGVEVGEDAERGFDHGAFVPLSVAWPQAEIPVTQISLVRGLDPALHQALGRTLAPLRDEGVLLLGSGMSYHNMQGFRTLQGQHDAQVFDGWLRASLGPAEREARLNAWAQAPSGRASHPREEHLLPLMVVAGAGGADPVSFPFGDDVLGTRVSAVRFG